MPTHTVQSRGPLAARVARLVNGGAVDQAFLAWAMEPMQAAFGPAPDATGLASAWLSARSLPDTRGRLRARFGPSWPLARHGEIRAVHPSPDEVARALQKAPGKS